MSLFLEDDPGLMAANARLPQSTGRPAGGAEYFGATLKLGGMADVTGARSRAIQAQYRAVASRVSEVEGQPFSFKGQDGRPAHTPRPFSEREPGGAEATDAFWARVNEAFAANPQDFTGLPLSQKEAEEAVAAEAQEQAAIVADIEARAGLGASIAGFAGMATAVMTDPIILMSSFAGGPALGTMLTAGKSARATAILKGALADAGIAGGAEAFVQPSIQQQRKALGLSGGLDEGLLNVGAAAVGGFVFGGGIRLGYRWAKRIEIAAYDELPPELKRTDATGAANSLDDTLVHQEGNPLRDPDSPEAVRLHQARIEAAVEAFNDGGIVRSTELPPDLLSTAALMMPEVRQRFARMLPHLGFDISDEAVERMTSVNYAVDWAMAEDRVESLLKRIGTAGTQEQEVIERLVQLDGQVVDTSKEAMVATNRVALAQRAIDGDMAAIKQVLDTPAWGRKIANWQRGGGAIEEGVSLADKQGTETNGDAILAALKRAIAREEIKRPELDAKLRAALDARNEANEEWRRLFGKTPEVEAIDPATFRPGQEMDAAARELTEQGEAPIAPPRGARQGEPDGDFGAELDDTGTPVDRVSLERSYAAALARVDDPDFAGGDIELASGGQQTTVRTMMKEIADDEQGLDGVNACLNPAGV